MNATICQLIEDTLLWHYERRAALRDRGRDIHVLGRKTERENKREIKRKREEGKGKEERQIANTREG